MDKNSVKKDRRQKANTPQFVLFGRSINKIAAVAVTALLLLIVAVVLVIVLAAVLQAE